MSDGIDIARWWSAEHASGYATVQSCDGFRFETDREAGSYTYIWLEAYHDGDYLQHYLLDVRTKPGDGADETRDYLVVSILPGQRGSGEPRLEVEWMQRPIPFSADHYAHQDRFCEGMRWFAERVIAAIQDFHDRETQ